MCSLGYMKGIDNMNNNTINGLLGTKTEQNLRNAAANEALSHVKYMIYSDIAKKEGKPGAARYFDRHASHEIEHAELWLSYLDELSDTDENLDSAKRSETYEANDYYPSLSKTAAEEGFTEIADKFRMAGTVENHHLMTLEELSESLAIDHHDDPETVWCCTNCGYHTKGNMPPERCPLCNYPKHYFVKE